MRVMEWRPIIEVYYDRKALRGEPLLLHPHQSTGFLVESLNKCGWNILLPGRTCDDEPRFAEGVTHYLRWSDLPGVTSGSEHPR